jgi:hypothetical protein
LTMWFVKLGKYLKARVFQAILFWYLPGHFELSDKLDLQVVIDYAKEKDVNLLLYYDRRHGEYGDD